MNLNKIITRKKVNDLAKFTVELGVILKSGFQLDLNSYPIFDESYRDELNNKIIRHYWFREIGFETAALFRDRLAVKMSEIMPYYNQLYKSTLINIEPLETHRLVRELTRTENNSGSSTVNADGKTVYSDTPQGLLNINSIEDEIYASNASLGNSVTDSQAQEDRNTGESEVKYGNTSNKSQSELLEEYRRTFLNIDMQIINELEGLFMGIWA